MAIMMALGDFEFSLNTLEYQSLKKAHRWRWVTLARFGRRPAQQFQGPDKSTWTLSIVHYPQNAPGLTQFQRLKSVADTGKPQRLIGGALRQGNGEVSGSALDFGLFVVERLDIQESDFLENGIALEQKGTLVISEYGEDTP